MDTAISINKFDATINEIIVVNEKIKIFRFSGIESFNFIPGQFVMASIPGFNTDKGIPIKRAFSIASKPKDNQIELCIECKNTGGFSEKIFSMKVGDKIIMVGPYGKFILNSDLSKNSVFLAAGVGIAPLMCMIRHSIHNNGSGKLLLLYSFREVNDFAYREELDKYTKKGNFKIVPFLTTKNNVKWNNERGRIDEERIRKYITDINSEFYICGGNEFNQEMSQLLQNIGVDKQRIHKEAFW